MPQRTLPPNLPQPPRPLPGALTHPHPVKTQGKGRGQWTRPLCALPLLGHQSPAFWWRRQLVPLWAGPDSCPAIQTLRPGPPLIQLFLEPHRW